MVNPAEVTPKSAKRRFSSFKATLRSILARVVFSYFSKSLQFLHKNVNDFVTIDYLCRQY